MHKLFGKRGFAVFTALALCVSLVSPSFAATFMDLQYAVQGSANGRNDLGDNRYGYGDEIGENKYEIEAWDDEDGARNVILNADVTAVGEETGVHIHSWDNDVVLDLNGHSVTGQERSGDGALVVNGGNLTLKDSTAQYDEDGNQISAGKGKVTGGKYGGIWVGHESEENTHGISPEAAKEIYGSFIMEGGTVEANKSHRSDSGSDSGSGVSVSGAGSTFTMTGGAIKDNKGNGPAVVVNNGAKFEMTGGLIESNATGNKDGVEVEGNSSFVMTGGSILVKDDAKTVQGDPDKVTITDGTFSQLDDDYLKGHDLVNGVLTHKWSNWETTSEAQVGIAGVEERHCLAGDCTKSETRDIPALEPAPEPVVEIPDEPEVEVEIEIDEPAVPLASGPVTGGEFIDYLWRHEGEPEADVVVDGEYALAISWAQSIGIISGDTFEPDELVTVGVVRDILANFAVYSDMVMPELTTLTGDEDEAVLNCDEVLAEFFGEELSE